MGSKIAERRPGAQRRAVDDPQRARPARGARPARASAHVGRPRPDRRGLPLLRRPPAARDREAAPVELDLVRREVDEAMRVTTETLSQVTNLLAIVSAPPIDTATIRHVEVLSLQPQVVMIVVITSTGGVSKRMLTFAAPVDPGVVKWAAEYLNERLVGLGPRRADAARAAARRPTSRATEEAFLAAARAGVHRAGRHRRGHALRRGRRPPAARAPLPGPLADQRADADARAPRGAARRAAHRAGQPRRARPHRRRERDAGAALARARRRRLRPAARAARHGLAHRPGAHGLRRTRSAPCARPRAQLSRFIADVYDEG